MKIIWVFKVSSTSDEELIKKLYKNKTHYKWANYPHIKVKRGVFMRHHSKRPYEFFEAESIISGKYHLPYEADKSEIKTSCPENEEEFEKINFWLKTENGAFCFILRFFNRLVTDFLKKVY